MRKRNHNEDIEISLKIEFIFTIVPGIIICISVRLNQFFFSQQKSMNFLTCTSVFETVH